MAVNRQYQVAGNLPLGLSMFNSQTKNQYQVPGIGNINSQSYSVVFGYCKYLFTKVGLGF